MPKVVGENSVGNLADILIESVKELTEQNKELKSRLDQLEGK